MDSPFNPFLAYAREPTFYDLLAGDGGMGLGGGSPAGPQGLPAGYGPTSQPGLQPGGFGVPGNPEAGPAVGPSPNATQTPDQTGYGGMPSAPAAPSAPSAPSPSNNDTMSGGISDAGTGRGGSSSGGLGAPAPPGLARNDNLGYARSAWGYTNTLANQTPTTGVPAPGTYGFYSDPVNYSGQPIDTKTPAETAGFGRGQGGSGGGGDNGLGPDGTPGSPGPGGIGNGGNSWHTGGPVKGKSPFLVNEEVDGKLLEDEHVVNVPAAKGLGRKFLDTANKEFMKKGAKKDAVLKKIAPLMGKD